MKSLLVFGLLADKGSTLKILGKCNWLLNNSVMCLWLLFYVFVCVCVLPVGRGL